MRTLILQEMAEAMRGRILGAVQVPAVKGVSTDSRGSVEGSLFFAITGPNFDGHAYVEDVLDKGAAAAVVSDLSGIDKRHHDSGRIILVSDTVEALGQLAAWYRRQFAAQVVAVVGSNGKTTTN